MKLTYMAGDSGEDGSPRIYRTDGEEAHEATIAVQGYMLDAASKMTAEPPLPGGEDIVLVPAALIHDASAKLRALGL